MDIFNFSRYYQIVLQNRHWNFYGLRMTVFLFLHLFHHLLFSDILFLANPMGMKQCLIVILSFMSLSTSEVEHFFIFSNWIFLCITCSSSLPMSSFMFFLLVCNNSLYLLNLMLPLLHMCPSFSDSGISFTYTSPTMITKVTSISNILCIYVVT